MEAAITTAEIQMVNLSAFARCLISAFAYMSIIPHILPREMRYALHSRFTSHNGRKNRFTIRMIDRMSNIIQPKVRYKIIIKSLPL